MKAPYEPKFVVQLSQLCRKRFSSGFPFEINIRNPLR